MTTLSPAVLLTLFAIFVLLPTARLSAQAPDPILLTPDRLARIQAGLQDPDSHYSIAFAQLKARVDSRDLDLFNRTATNWNYARSYYAQAAAFVYRVTGEAQYAQWAFEALWDVHNDIDPDGRLPEAGGDAGNAGLVRATVGLGFGLAYNWAYDAWTTEQRDYVRNRVHVALNMWLGYSHANLTQALRGSNWVAVCRGGELMMILGIGEQSTRSTRVNTLVNDLRLHLQNGHDAIGSTQEGIGYAGYGGIFLLPAIYAARDAGNMTLWNFMRDTPRQWHQKAMYSGSFASVPSATSLQNRRTFQPSGVGGPNTNDEGWASLILGSVPEADRAHFLWWYDRHMGRLAEPRDRPELHFDPNRQGTMWALLFYPDDVTPVDPTGSLPILITGDQGRHFMRARWQDENDISVSIHADLRHHPNAWAQSEAGQTGLMAYGVTFFNGPRTSREGSDYTRMLVNGNRGIDNDPGRRAHMETFSNGAYVVVDGHTQYRNMGVEAYHRHLLVEFGDPADNNALVTMLDRVDNYTPNTYTWNANIGNAIADFGIVSALGTDQGFPTFTMVAPNGGTLKGWVIYPLGAQVVLQTGDRLSVEKTAASEDFLIVMSLEPESPAPLQVLDQGNAGVRLAVGSKTVAFDRRNGTLLHGTAAQQLVLDHDTPLSIRGLTARVVSANSVHLRWFPINTGAQHLIIEQRGPGESTFTPIATIAGSSTHFTAKNLLAESNYSWRVVAASGPLRSEPSAPVSALTWEAGLALYVEDFAPRINGNLPLRNAIGQWQFRNQDRGWELRATTGSPRNAENPIGEVATAGRSRINFQNVLYTEGFTADLSTASAAVEVDIMTEGTIRFSLMLKLASGQWVRTSGEAHIASRTAWQRQRWSIPSITGWLLYDPQTFATGAAITLTAQDLEQIHGIGIRAQWPLNERWARLDQLHLYARNFVPEVAPPEGFDLWRALVFGPDAHDEAIAGFSANPSGDGIPNGLKYAMGLDPLSSAAANWPQQRAVQNGIEFTYSHDMSAADVDLLVEISYDLNAWFDASGYLTEVGRVIQGDVHLITVQAATPGESIFVRLRAVSIDHNSN